MKELLELMNNYAHTYADHYDDTGEEITITFFSHGDQCFQYVCDGSYETLVDDIVISKRFGFISWLIDNDKIDTSKYNFCTEVSGICGDVYKNYGAYESLLMLLSISSSPIEDLISYLK